MNAKRAVACGYVVLYQLAVPTLHIATRGWWCYQVTLATDWLVTVFIFERPSSASRVMTGRHVSSYSIGL